MFAEPTGKTSVTPKRRADGRKDSADTVRALSALIVVVSHAVQIIWLPVLGLGTYTHRINSFLSDTAVIVFFVLSGFLIASSIGTNVTHNGRFVAQDFAISRTVRIGPPLLFATVLSALLYLALVALQFPGAARPLAAPGDLYSARDLLSVTPNDIWNTLTMRNGLLVMNGPLWSLYVEVKLYAIAGIVAYAVAGAAPWGVRLGIVSGCLWFGREAGLGIPDSQWFYCSWWLLGAAFYLLGLRHWVSNVGRACICALAGAALWLSPLAVGLEAMRLAFVCAITFAMFYRWRWSEPSTKSVAAHSYTLYLIHFPILIAAYAVLVALAGDAGPSITARIVTSVLGIVVAFWCSLIAGGRLEDARGIKINLYAFVAKAKRSV